MRCILLFLFFIFVFPAGLFCQTQLLMFQCLLLVGEIRQNGLLCFKILSGNHRKSFCQNSARKKIKITWFPVKIFPYPPAIKHGVLENLPFISMTFPAINLHLYGTIRYHCFSHSFLYSSIVAHSFMISHSYKHIKTSFHDFSHSFPRKGGFLKWGYP